MDDLTTRIEKLEAVLGLGNFNSSSVQQKDAVFNGRLKMVKRTALPTVAAIGEVCIAAPSGTVHFYVCKAANTWTLIT